MEPRRRNLKINADLGSGGGLDVFLAAAKVGPTGKAIGIDLTSETLVRDPNATKVEPYRITAAGVVT